ncbi:MAG: hypothetical protein OXH81_14255 [Gemmatimonadetes bacterium]|nr:hypothetical protein [Gemmatimonadota bacterium]
MKAIMLVVVLLPTCLWSQELGDYVRVRVGEKTFKGTIEIMSARCMRLEMSRRKKVVCVEEIESIEKRISYKSHWRKGAVYGFRVGGIVGALLGLSVRDGAWTPQPETTFLMTLTSGISGTLVGVVIGALYLDETWMTIEKPYKITRLPRLQITPVGLRASWRF